MSALLDVSGLTVRYDSVTALDDVSFSIAEGETLGLVGESGSGKSTVARAIMRIVDPAAGAIRFRGTDLTTLSPRALRAVRRDVQMVFQDPFSSLDPRFRVVDIIAEPLKFAGVGRTERRERAREVMALVGLDPVHAGRYPHEFSGGQRQRIGIARALALRPALLVCDEPTSALDVSVQAQVINLLMDLREQFDLTLLFISHDLGVIEALADRVAVMYSGRIVETAPSDALFATPRHAYTRELLAASTSISEERKAGWGPLPSAAPRAATAGALVEVAPSHFVRGEAECAA